MEHQLRSKKSLQDFSDRELLEVILSNQILIFRKVSDLESLIQTKRIEGHGPYENTVHDLLTDADQVLLQANQYLGRTDSQKTGRPYGE